MKKLTKELLEKFNTHSGITAKSARLGRGSMRPYVKFSLEQDDFREIEKDFYTGYDMSYERGGRFVGSVPITFVNAASSRTGVVSGTIETKRYYSIDVRIDDLLELTVAKSVVHRLKQ